MCVQHYSVVNNIVLHFILSLINDYPISMWVYGHISKIRKIKELIVPQKIVSGRSAGWENATYCR